MNPDSFNPEEALAVAENAGGRMAERAVSPPWYAPVYGSGVGLLVAAPGFPDRLMPMAYAAGLAVALGAYAVWSRATGLSVSGFRTGRTLPVAVGLLLFVLAAASSGLILQRALGWGWAPLAAGVVAALGAAAGSRMWDAAWRADLRDGR